MDDYLTLPGSSALSAFRLQALARDLKAERIVARHVHYIAFHDDNRGQFGDEDKRILGQLLEYDEPFQGDAKNSDHERSTTFYVTPRVGTISPWVSASSR